MSGESFLQGAFIGAMCWLAGSVIWDSIERHRRDRDKIRREVYASPSLSATSSFGKVEPQVRIGQMNALNGRLLEVSTTRLNKHGDRDFVVEYYIIDEAKPLSEQIAVVMLMKGLEK